MQFFRCIGAAFCFLITLFGTNFYRMYTLFGTNFQLSHTLFLTNFRHKATLFGTNFSKTIQIVLFSFRTAEGVFWYTLSNTLRKYAAELKPRVSQICSTV